MARAEHHYNCTGRYELAYWRVVYIRETSPARWVNIGYYCPGCKAFQPKL